MPAIIPIPAFTDNYIRILRGARCGAFMNPGDANPAFAVARANRFLRAGEPAVFGAAEVRAGREPVDAADAFAALRDWNNKL